ncbi:MAG: DUF4393 domain-containing protein [Candidatus Caenarcaniphilales bacterium]|nr:DUF4393 domain-containing protein [Candidatus Caenarcaniphilales bacterium]
MSNDETADNNLFSEGLLFAKTKVKMLNTISNGLVDIMNDAFNIGLPVLQEFIKAVFIYHFEPYYKYNIIKEEELKQFAKDFTEKYKNIPEAKVIDTPNAGHVMQIFSGLSQTITQQELRLAYTNLLCNAIHSDYKETIHPCYMEILKNLSNIELIMLLHFYKQFKKEGGGFTIIDFAKYNPDDSFNSYFSNFNEAYLLDELKSLPIDLLQTSFDNLVRLNIVGFMNYAKINDEKEYKKIETSFFENNFHKGDEDIRSRGNLGAGIITELGKNFIQTCSRDFN